MTAAPSEVDIVATLRSANADYVRIAAEIMTIHFKVDYDTVKESYTKAGAIAALMAAMATHGAHPGAQEQLCRAITVQVRVNKANQVWELFFF